MGEEGIAAAFRDACRFDVLSFKPGNVSFESPGHGMEAHDFLRSAAVSASPIADPTLGVGERVLAAVRATREAVACNTNLGILLLAAPLARAAQSNTHADLRQRLARVLSTLTVADAQAAFDAICLAAPAGLGTAAAQDVRSPPSVDLREAMRLAAAQDQLAAQYVNDYAAVFELGLDGLHAQLAEGASLADAAQHVYLLFVREIDDAHVLRKHGRETAQWLRARGGQVASAWPACHNPRQRHGLLQRFDSELKARGVNPGTSADLTVASLFALSLSVPPHSPAARHEAQPGVAGARSTAQDKAHPGTQDEWPTTRPQTRLQTDQ